MVGRRAAPVVRLAGETQAAGGGANAGARLKECLTETLSSLGTLSLTYRYIYEKADCLQYMYLPTMVLNEMLFSLLWILTILDRIGLADGDTVTHPHIFPSSPVIERGSTLEVFCNLGKKLYPYKNASHIIWTLNDDHIAKENYIIVNESVSGVIIHNFTYGKACVKCFLDSPFEKQLMAHTEVKSGLKFDPPEITKIETIPGIKQMLTVTWKVTYNLGRLNCQIRYKAPTKHHLEVVNCAMGWSKTKSINLTNLWDSTNYTVDLRCAHIQSKFWSEWSASKTGITEEQAPMKVDLWRILESQPTGNRIVHLLWKKSEEFPSSGIILDYKIKYSTKNSSFSETTSNETATCSLTEEAYEISVVARNAAGLSPEAILRIPSIHEERKDQQIVNLSASPVCEEMVVEWETSGFNGTDYVIEWYDELETDVYKRSWKYVNVTNWTSPKGPSKGPKPKVEKLGKHEATITWNEVAKADSNGDIVNYTVFYKPEDGKELRETVNASFLQCHLKSLHAKTKYIVRVMASTRAGGKSGDEIDFITDGLSIVENILINIVVGIFMLSLLTVGSLWILKKYSLKNICWPQIPHPTVSDCSAVSQNIMLREPPFEHDTKLPDVISILEVDACNENHDDDVHLPILENDFNQVDVTTEGVDRRQQMLCSTELEDIKPLPQAIPSLGQDLNHHTLLALEVFKENENEQVQGQTNWKETTEFFPYLKNSVPTREFLCCENSNQTLRESKNSTSQLAACTADDTGQPYVALNTFELFSKHE
ncbi:hypothetical protein lerEdw1_000466 [Lerista edwardsae]|nr:hypothetical protein lerEdw1_000466 [Lerista edwardsae]